MAARTIGEFIQLGFVSLMEGWDSEPYFFARESARLHINDGMRQGLSMEQLMPHCEHLNDVLPKSVVGCYQRDLYAAYLNDFLESDPRLGITGGVNSPEIINVHLAVYNSLRWPVNVAAKLGTSLSFGREGEISKWIVDNRYQPKNRKITDDAVFVPFRDSLTGFELEWLTGTGMISSDNEEIRTIRKTTENYKSSHDSVLKIHSAIPPDRNSAQELFSIDTTSSYRIKSARMLAQKFVGSEASEVERIISTDQFTGDGNVYKLTYGVWVTNQNLVLSRAVNETAPRRFKYLEIEFERNPG